MVDLKDFKAVSFKKKSDLVSGNQVVCFPLIIKKKEQPPDKLAIADKLDDLVNICHGSDKSKKTLLEEIVGKYPQLRKTHVDHFLKSSFTKERRPLDNKVCLLQCI
jgi:hypothetical protein